IADGHNRPISWQIGVCERAGLAATQCVVRVHVHASGNRPLCVVVVAAHIYHGHWPVRIEPCAQRLGVDLFRLSCLFVHTCLVRRSVSRINPHATIPDRNVSTPAACTAHTSPNIVATTPAISAPTA